MSGKGEEYQYRNARRLLYDPVQLKQKKKIQLLDVELVLLLLISKFVVHTDRRPNAGRIGKNRTSIHTNAIHG